MIPYIADLQKGSKRCLLNHQTSASINKSDHIEPNVGHRGRAKLRTLASGPGSSASNAGGMIPVLAMLEGLPLWGYLLDY